MTIFNGTVTGTSWASTSDLPEERLIWDVASIDTAGNPSAFSPRDEARLHSGPREVGGRSFWGGRSSVGLSRFESSSELSFQASKGQI